MPDITCPVCHSVNASTRTFCWKCAADLHAVVADPTAPPPPPKVIVPIQPLLIGGGIALAAIALIALLVVFLGGSPAATTAPSGGASITPVPDPAIVSFKGPATVDCADPAYDGFITLTWLVTDAESTELSIDGPGIYQAYPGVQGNYRVPFGCGAGEHRYTLTTVGGNGPAATKTLTIKED